MAGQTDRSAGASTYLDDARGIDYRTAMAATVATALAPMSALDERGQTVPLASFWQLRPAVVAFVRHFG